MPTHSLRAAIKRLRFGSRGAQPADLPDEGGDVPSPDGEAVEASRPEAVSESFEEPAQPPTASDEPELIAVTPAVFEGIGAGGYEKQRSESPHRETRGRDARHRKEKKMAERLRCRATGITEVIVDDFAEDARVRTSDELEEIIVVAEPDGPDRPQLVVEDDKVYLRDGFAARVEVPSGIAVTAKEALGDLKISRLGGDLRLRNVMGDLRVENVTGRVEIEHVYGNIRAEDVAEMQLSDCEADFRFSGGDLHVETVNGDMRVTDAGSVQTLRVHGDLWLERLTGGVKIEAAHGDVRINDVKGAAGLGVVAGDFRATNVRGALNVGQVQGDAQLEGPFPATEGYGVNTNGDAHIRLLAEDDVRLTVRASGRVRSNLPLTPSADGSTTYTATLGEGKVRVVLTANGDLRVEAASGGGEDVRGPGDRRWGSGGEPLADLSGLGERIRQQVSASLAAAGINPETGEINLNLGFGRERRGRARQPDAPRPPRPGAAPGAPAAPGPMTGEQLAVLKMLEEGRISPEEADSLLRALGA